MKKKEQLNKRISKGSIFLSDSVRITDPCYKMDTWCAGSIGNVLEGEYSCYVDFQTEGEYVSAIEVRRKGYEDVEPIEYVADLDVGVDSWQAGIFDETYFKNLCNNKEKKDAFYDKVCNLTSRSDFVPNPNYKEFKDSHYYIEDFALLESAYEDPYDIVVEALQIKIFLREAKTEEEIAFAKEKELLGADILEYFQQWERYYHDEKVSRETVYKTLLDGNTVDGKGLVSASGYGDYACFVGRNNDGKIVSIKIDYFPDYELLESIENEEMNERY